METLDKTNIRIEVIRFVRAALFIAEDMERETLTKMALEKFPDVSKWKMERHIEDAILYRDIGRLLHAKPRSTND